MSRKFGLMTLPSNLEVQYQGPLDARTVVGTYADLFAADTFKSTDGVNYAYKGLIVSVTEDTTSTDTLAAGYLNGTYVLLGDDSTEEANWGRLVTSSADGLVDYRTGVSNYPTINGVEIDGDLSIEDLGFQFLTAQVVDELPAIAEAERNVVYFAPDTDTESTEYEEYMIKEVATELTEAEYDAQYPAETFPDQCYIDAYVDSITQETVGPFIRTYELIGRAELDLSGYYTKEETDELTSYFDRDADGALITDSSSNVATDIDAYNAGGEAKTSYVTVGNIPAGTVMNGTQMQDLVEDLFYAVVDSVVTEPTATITFEPAAANLTTSGEVLLVKPIVEYDCGTVTLDGVDKGTYAGEATVTYLVGGVAATLNADGYLEVSTTSGNVLVTATVTFADGTALVKSDGSASEVTTYASASVSGSMTVTAVGIAYDCAGGTEAATAVANDCINVEEGYIDCVLTATNAQVVKISESFGDVLGVQQYNGFTRAYEYVGGSAAASLEEYTVTEGADDDAGFHIVTYVGITAGARTIRVIVGEEAQPEAEGIT